MLATLSLVVMAAAAATPCEMLDAMSTPQIAIKASSAPAGPFVAPGATPAGAGCRPGRSRAPRRRPRCRRIAACGWC